MLALTSSVFFPSSSWFLASRVLRARVCTAATAPKPIRPTSNAAARPVTAVLLRLAQRRARSENGSRRADTGSSANQALMSAPRFAGKRSDSGDRGPAL